MKDFPLVFISIAWVCETILMILFTMVAIVVLPPERINLWIEFCPILAILIGAQGTAAGIGPLASDSIKAKANNNNKEATCVQ